MKIAVMAAGGVGGYFGARLAAAGYDVSFVARGSHLEAMRRDGLRIESGLGDLKLDPLKATGDPGEIGPVDVVMFAVKLWDTEEAAAACRPLVGDGTAVISFQNGIGAIDVLSRVLGPEHALGGTAHIASVIAGPGTIRHTGVLARLTFGETDNRRSPRLEAFLEACAKAGVDAEIADDMKRAVWEKFIFLTALSGTTTVARRPLGPILADPDLRRAFLSAMEETAALAREKGVDIEDGVIDRLMTFAEELPGEMKSSMLRDLEGGKRLEVEWLSGGVSLMSRDLGLASPVNDTIFAALKPYAGGSAGRREAGNSPGGTRQGDQKC
ncbi:MAG: ketopantoate reductase family protein [Rhodospirillales bacterium]